MALINTEFTLDDVRAAKDPNPKGRYRAKFTGLYRKDKNKPTEIFSVSDKGNVSLWVRLTPLPPAKNTSNLLFFGTVGFASLASVVEALPSLFVTGPDGKAQIDENAALGTEVWIDLDVETAEQGSRQGEKVNVVKNIYNIKKFT